MEARKKEERRNVCSYVAQYSVLRTVQRVLCFTPGRPVHSSASLGFSGKHSAMLQLLHENYSFRYPPLSAARYLFIQTAE